MSFVYRVVSLSFTVIAQPPCASSLSHSTVSTLRPPSPSTHQDDVSSHPLDSQPDMFTLSGESSSDLNSIEALQPWRCVVHTVRHSVPSSCKFR
ncbi:hypothetical protein FKP32DRAFT_888112 [Trametes sanguinea]|nr:hypothetical protein FKP32DRAFT_888112 [Trametes sanguinea]